MTSFGIFTNFFFFKNTPRGTGSPNRHRASRGRATAPRLPHTAALGVTGERMGAAAELGERGASKGALLGTASWIPGNGVKSSGREGFP